MVAVNEPVILYSSDTLCRIGQNVNKTIYNIIMLTHTYIINFYYNNIIIMACLGIHSCQMSSITYYFF